MYATLLHTCTLCKKGMHIHVNGGFKTSKYQYSQTLLSQTQGDWNKIDIPQY